MFIRLQSDSQESQKRTMIITLRSLMTRSGAVGKLGDLYVEDYPSYDVPSIGS